MARTIRHDVHDKQNDTTTWEDAYKQKLNQITQRVNKRKET